MVAPSGVGSLNTWSTRAIVLTMAPILIGLSILQMVSGAVLETLEETYLGNPTLLVLVPVMIDMGGNLGCILASRLSTRLHLGVLEFDIRDTALWTNVIAILGLAATIFTILGFAAYGVGQFITGEPLPLFDLLLISLLSGMSLAVLAILLAVSATYVSYRMGLDPDDTTIPVVTNVADICGVLILSGVAILVLDQDFGDGIEETTAALVEFVVLLL
ncbi:MgtE family transport protein [Natronomonas pharaonis DSM 2160]|uniref:MgtE family transport protein n=1 Tax=Natronomonas pharaonis (strain ATCC 35678 / DSM 2160 / CIP 103997 / JCM 8858 / NBRC 14720 / NCIMB 2260 / Gabara) TaxID=348780 RepID=A0A1U7ETH4_NATPD|nr:magnesium transporter [Natronomonas pharaonis]CAI48202.1 MgtE family transport protein [Natronomonas pharaonis DSM 2160]